MTSSVYDHDHFLNPAKAIGIDQKFCPQKATKFCTLQLYYSALQFTTGLATYLNTVRRQRVTLILRVTLLEQNKLCRKILIL
jgi:hypothetical protein